MAVIFMCLTHDELRSRSPRARDVTMPLPGKWLGGGRLHLALPAQPMNCAAMNGAAMNGAAMNGDSR
jgi:hypothetical protein